MSREWGPVLIGLGLLLLVLGLVAWGGGLSWFGRLPGDVRMERGSTRVYFPWVSMLLASAALTVLLNLLTRFRR